MTNSIFAGEPDREEFEHAGLKCLIQRSDTLKVLCGYVGVPQNHPFYGKDFIDEAFCELDVHGGITFAEKGDGDTWKRGLWWIGFDCAHEGDLTPQFKLGFHDDGVYRDITYVREQTKKLAEQLHTLSLDSG